MNDWQINDKYWGLESVWCVYQWKTFTAGILEIHERGDNKLVLNLIGQKKCVCLKCFSWTEIRNILQHLCLG